MRRRMAILAIVLAQAGSAATTDGAEPGPGGQEPAAVHASVLDAALHWLAEEFGLPEVAELPRIAFAPPERLVALHLGDASHAASAATGPEVVAVYVDAQRTIYLPQGWTGATPAETSVLIHELVHHVQNLAGLGYACPAEREKPAFAAQAAWLERHGSDLETAFGIDAMTLLVRTGCLH
jgi:hypothetical protein